MNAKLFRLVFSKHLGMRVPVGEGAPARDGKTSSGKRARRTSAALAIVALAAGTPACANPTDPTVTNGQASFGTQGNTLTIINSPNAIINWKGFSIGRDEITRFIQQNSSSAVLNRVVGQNPSSILGALQSNGRVFLINPNGILFGQGARIDVAGLVASSLNLTDQDFLAGRLRFLETPGAGGIVNQGAITTPSGGQVYLVAPNVENNGIITTPQGEIILAAGKSVELVNPGTPNISVQISAPDNQAVNVGRLVAQGGSIGIYAGLVWQRGSVNATSAVAEGGRIFLRGSQSVELAAGSGTEASGAAGGGQVVVSSGESTTVAAGASIEANASQMGDGGKVKVWSDGSTQFDGNVAARGGEQSGNGGFAETSGQHIVIGDTARVDTRATNGKAGTWLIDPIDFTIAASGGDISGATLSANLAGGSVLIQSSTGFDATGSGDINVDDSVSWSANNLTLVAAHDININAVMTVADTSSLTLNAATPNGTDAALAGGMVRVGFNPDGSFKGRVDSPGRSGVGFLTINGNDYFVLNGTGYTVVNVLGGAGSTTGTDLQGINGNLSGFYALGSDIDASATAGWNAGAGFTPVGNGRTAFTGVFDGLGHTISNLTINRPTESHVGLFGYSAGGSVRNVGLEGSSVVGQVSVGGLVGYNSLGTVSNSYVTGSVSGGASSSSIGGLVGGNYGAIGDSHAAAAVNGGDGSYYIGGLAGLSNGAISNSHATGAVTAGNSSRQVGGLIGMATGGSSTISSSYAMGAVTAGTDSWNLGGLAGELTSNATITGSYATGAVSGGDNVYSIGGLVGNVGGSGIVVDSFATGSVIGGPNADRVGGLVGQSEGSIAASYSTGYVSGGAGASKLGGLAGADYGTISNSFWDTETSGQGTSAGGTGLTTAQMMQSSSYGGWDFNSTWAAVNGTSFPYQQRLFSGGVQVASGTVGGYIPTGQQAALSIDGTGYGSYSIGANGFYYVALPAGTASAGQQVRVSLANGAQSGAYVGTAEAGQNTGLDFNVGELLNAGTLSLANSIIGLALHNTGTINLGGALTFSGLFTNDGTLNVTAGVNVFNGGLIQNSGNLNLDGGSIQANLVLAGGNANINSGTFTAVGTTHIGGLGTLSLNGGTYNTGTNNDIDVSGTFNWGNGTLAGTGGAIVVGAIGQMSLTGGGGADRAFDGRTLSNNGSVTLKMDPDSYLVLMNGGNITNQAQFNITANGIPMMAGEGAGIAAGGAAGIFTNNGTLTKNGLGDGYINVAFDNNNTVIASAGLLDITNGGTHLGGSFAGNGGTVEFMGGTHTFNGANAFSGNITLSGGSFAGTGTITNGGSFDIQSDTVTAPAIVNNGTVTKSAGTGSVVFNGSFANVGTVNANSGTLDFAAGYSQSAGTTTMRGGNISGNVALNGGVFNGAGTVTGNVNHAAGTVSPGFSPGRINIAGDYTQGPGGTLAIELGGLVAGTQYDVLNIGGSAALGGTLNVSYYGAFTAAAGASFTPINAASVTGAFATVNVPPASGLSAAYDSNSMRLAGMPIPPLLLPPPPPLVPPSLPVPEAVIDLRQAAPAYTAPGQYAARQTGIDELSSAILAGADPSLITEPTAAGPNNKERSDETRLICK